MVRVITHAGFCEIPRQVTPRIHGVVVAMQAGARWQPDETVLIRAALCERVLQLGPYYRAGEGNSHQTMLVEVAKSMSRLHITRR